ncbi:hypothetical protein DERP_007126 [Dermatophagoides pteronyssinus]|uniref:Uncharacterized protein n=1 Tax=Dermatophagoides pteronyssinus TaxID=6956 RepID=A0ABQ8JU81_DERPT|nr:hypothetical protein DERP_007126 [Dermatophagoides pteronyssinus]
MTKLINFGFRFEKQLHTNKPKEYVDFVAEMYVMYAYQRRSFAHLTKLKTVDLRFWLLQYFRFVRTNEYRKILTVCRVCISVQRFRYCSTHFSAGFKRRQ